jgi:arginyl-tRNA synthetase
VQYTAVRCRSIQRKVQTQSPGLQPLMKASGELKSAEEMQLMAQLLYFEEVLTLAFNNFKPHLLAGYLLDLCRTFSQFYSRHRILGEEPSKASARLALVQASEKIIVQGLRMLNIETPEAM